MELYPPRAVEWAMKVQEVILRAMSGQIKWFQAAELIGVSPRTMRRWRRRYEEYGYDGLYDRRLKRPSPKRVLLATVEKVLRLYQEKYRDFNVAHFVEKLHFKEGIPLSYRWVKKALSGVGTGSEAAATGDAPATPTAASHFVHTPVAGYPPDREHRTRVARALERLEIELIVAHSPQARGRCERMFGTWQCRLPQELRLRGIRTLKEADRYLREGWIGFHNRRFTVPPAPAGTAFVSADGIDLEQIFSHQENRVVGADNTVRYRRRILQIEPQRFRHTLAKCRVWVREHLDGDLSLYYGLHRLGRYDRQGRLLHEEVA